jgi:hypothetical protein
MVKTQIQIPDHLFREAKRIAGECEMSFAQVVRMGLEGVVRQFPADRCLLMSGVPLGPWIWERPWHQSGRLRDEYGLGISKGRAWILGGSSICDWG